MHGLARHVPARPAGVLLGLRDRAGAAAAPRVVAAAPVLLAGDSLVRRWPLTGTLAGWATAAQPGATTTALRRHLRQALAEGPERVVLLAGTNDLLRGVPVRRLVAAYSRLLDEAIVARPAEAITILAVPPMRTGAQRRIPAPSRIAVVNDSLRALAAVRGARWLDTFTPLAEADGRLAAHHTVDGVHLTAAAYARLSAVLVAGP